MLIKKGWSFCIVSLPNNEIILDQCINKIQKEFSGEENYEIIVVGNIDLEKISNTKNLKNLPFNEEVFCLKIENIIKAWKEKSFRRLFFRTGAICHKKNLAAKNALFEKLCIMHDYIGIEKGWMVGFKNLAENWDICMNIILNFDGTRHRDWLVWDHPAVTNGRQVGAGACLLPYDKYSKYMYISGAYFCVKKYFFLENLLNEKLFQAEAEDVEWSMRVRKKTKFKMNQYSLVKYLKLKPKNEAPYIDTWVENRKKIEEIFKNNYLDC